MGRFAPVFLASDRVCIRYPWRDRLVHLDRLGWVWGSRIYLSRFLENGMVLSGSRVMELGVLGVHFWLAVPTYLLVALFR